MHSNTAIFYSSQTPIVIRSIPVPPLKRGEVLVRNTFVTLCRSDLNTYCGKRTEKVPTILGHEVVGKIQAFGADALMTDARGQQLNIGDRITWAIFASNPADPRAKAGMPQKAPDLFKYGHEKASESNSLHGGLSEYVILRANTPIVKLSTDIKDKTAAIINCAVATVAGAVRISKEIKGKKVLVSGAGMLGCTTCAMLKQKGAAQVFVLDQNAQRLNFARNFGIDGVIQISNDVQFLTDTHSHSFDLVYDFTGHPTIIEYTLKALDIGGMAVLIGSTFPQRPLLIDAEYIVRNLLTITGLHNYNVQDLIAAADFMEQNYNRYPFEQMIWGGYHLHQVNEAFEFALQNNPFRVGIDLQKNLMPDHV